MLFSKIKPIVLFFLTFLILEVPGNSVNAHLDKPTLLYIFDPICGWCYTFNPVIEKLHHKFKHQIDFTVASGGMMVGKNVRPISDLAEYILAGHKDMENLTGVDFGNNYIQMVQKGTEVLNSEKPSCALTAFKTFQAENALDFSHVLQNAHFRDGKSFNHDSTYLQLVSKYNIDGNEFLRLMNSDSIKTKTRTEFKKIEEIGIGSFPTVLIRKNGKVVKLTDGFEKYEKLEKKLVKILKTEL